MKGWKWGLIGWLVLGGMQSPGMPSLGAARTDPVEKDITQKKKDLKDIRKEITLTKEKEKEIRGQESSILENLSQIDNELYQKGERTETDGGTVGADEGEVAADRDIRSDSSTKAWNGRKRSSSPG